MSPAWAALVATVLVVVLPRSVQAQPIDEKLALRGGRFERDGKWVALTVSWRDVVDAKIRQKLLSGLPTVIASRVYVFPSGNDRPVALSVATCRVVYDLWDEVFRIEVRQGGQSRQALAVNVEGVLRRCGEARRRHLVATTVLNGGERYFAAVLVEVNPLSKEMMDRIKRWVSLPKGAGAVGPGDSLFGSFVGLFVTHVPAADRVLSFRSQVFSVAALPVVKAKP